MKLWQKMMIRLALSPSIKRFAQKFGDTSALSGRFVGGKDEAHAVHTSKRLLSLGIRASFFHLGEYVVDDDVLQETSESLMKTIKTAGESGLDIHISVDPTQIGLLKGYNECLKNILGISQCIQNQVGISYQTSNLELKKVKHLLMLDMEDASVTQATLDLYEALAEKGLPSAITLQACLFRTGNDLDHVMGFNGSVRLVKGAFAENRDISLTRKIDVDQRYFRLAKRMLSKNALEKGFYPVFGTHDHRLVKKITAYARKMDIKPGAYEFEMLYGVRPDFQKKLVKNGEAVRVYLPYGRDWWPYCVRRIGENPGNIKMVFRSLTRW